MQMKDKVALVTGGSSGIGRAIALAWAREGAKVVLSDINAKAGEETVAQLRDKGCEALFVAADASKPADSQNLVERAVAKFGRLDVACNNAGIAGPTAKLEDTSLAQWNETIAVNLTGQFLCARAAVPLLKAAGGGSIVNMSSAAGRLGFPLRTPYSASKFGVIGLTASWAMELGPSHIRVNSILPGVVAGDRQERVIAAKAASYGLEHEAMRERLLSKVSLRSMVSAQDIAQQILFICSPAGARISGQSLSVCGNVEHLG